MHWVRIHWHRGNSYIHWYRGSFWQRYRYACNICSCNTFRRVLLGDSSYKLDTQLKIVLHDILSWHTFGSIGIFSEAYTYEKHAYATPTRKVAYLCQLVISSNTSFTQWANYRVFGNGVQPYEDQSDKIIPSKRCPLISSKMFIWLFVMGVVVS